MAVQPDKPEYLQPIKDNIPPKLKERSQWVLWQAVFKSDKKKPWDKEPINAKTGRRASTTDPITWTNFNTVHLKRINGNGTYDGIGYVLSEKDPFTGWDLDNCRNPETGEIESWVKKYIDRLNSYTEISPSGKGIRIFTRAKLPPNGRRKGKIEVYNSGRYLTLTGHHIQGSPLTIEDRQSETDTLHAEIFGKKETSPLALSGPINHHSLNNSDLLQKAFRSKNGEKIRQLYNGKWESYQSQSEADLALCQHLAFWFNRDTSLIDSTFRASALHRKKWNQKHFSDGRTYGQATIQKAIEGTTETYQKNQGRENYLNTHNDQDTCAQSISDIDHKINQEKNEDKNFAFPFQVMTGAGGYFSTVYGSCLETPEHFLFISYLTCIGSILSTRLTLNTELRPQPRLYSVLVGESATERKSTVLNKTMWLFKDTIKNFHTCLGVGSAEGLQKRIKNTRDDEGNIFGLLLIQDELKLLVQKCKIEASVLLPLINTLFESNHFESHTKSSEIIMEDANLSLLAASTLQTFESMFGPAFINIGFINRLFIVPGTAERKFSIPIKVSESDWNQLRNDLLSIIRHVGDGLELDITKEAKRYYHNWYMRMENSVHNKRLDAYALRFMMLLAVNELKSEVDIDIVKKATALCDWQLEVRKIHDPIDADTKSARMEERIRRHLKTNPLRDRELKQKTGANRAGLWIYDMAIHNLQKAGEIGWNKSSKLWFWAE